MEPQVSVPHQVDNVQPISVVAGKPVDQVFIGTCTNGRLEDISIAAEILRGQKIAAGTRMIIIPASSQVLHSAVDLGYISILLEAGATLGTPGCGPCMGNHLGYPPLVKHVSPQVIATSVAGWESQMPKSTC
ncbi:MAG: hypothetical protein CM1200mP6_07820 [Anaerolineaceae bacterium]|nr:MAG: hypothetical protein CM1200mP6_07820 [Anaerolineaceae bacterium]